MKPFEIYIAYISWGSGGKDRPVLLLIFDDGKATVYPITTQYEIKTNADKIRLLDFLAE